VYSLPTDYSAQDDPTLELSKQVANFNRPTVHHLAYTLQWTDDSK